MLLSKLKKLPNLRPRSFLKFQSTSNSKSHSFHWKKYSDKIAVIDSVGKFTYNSLYHGAIKLSQILSYKGYLTNYEIVIFLHYIDLFYVLFLYNNSCLLYFRVTLGEKVAFLCPNKYEYVVCQMAIWLAGGVAVPLCKSKPFTLFFPLIFLCQDTDYLFIYLFYFYFF